MARKRTKRSRSSGKSPAHKSTALSPKKTADRDARADFRRLASGDGVCVGVLALFALVFFSSILKIDEVFYGSDLVLSFYYYTDFTFRMLREGIFPFWNPYIFSGTPYFSAANGLYYPLHYLFFWMPTPLAMNLNLVTHFFLAGAFTYGFLRGIGQSRLPALVGGLVFMFPVLELLHVFGGHIPRLEARVWIPFVFWMYHAFFRTQKTRYFVLGALGITFALSVGHLQIAFYLLFCLGLYFLYLLSTRNGLSLLRNAGGFAGFVLLGIGAAAVQVLPVLLWGSEAGRAQSYEFATSFSFPPVSLLTALVPFVFGDRINGFYFGPSIIWEASLFFGVIAILLAGVALTAKRDRPTWFFFGAALLCLVVALGKHTPLYQLFYYGIPGYSFFRVPGRMLTVFVFFVAVLAAMGAARLFDDPGRKWRIGLIGMVLAILGGAMLFLWTEGPEGDTVTRILTSLVSDMRHAPRDVNEAVAEMAPKAYPFVMTQLGISAAVTAGFAALTMVGIRWPAARGVLLVLLVLGIFGEQVVHGSRYLSTIPSSRFDWESPIEELIEEKNLSVDKAAENGLYRVLDSRQTANLDRGMRYDVSSLNGYEGGILKRYNEFVNVARGKPKDKYYAVLKFRRYHPMLDLLNVKYLFDHGRPSIRSDRFKPIFRSRSLTISERTEPFPRAWVVHDTRLETDGDAILNRLFQQRDDLRRTVLIEDKDAKQLSSNDPAPVSEAVRIARYSPNRIELDATLQTPGYLVLSEIDHPGWQATVNGEPKETVRADYLLRALYLDAGNHHIEWGFLPPGFYPGLIISVVSLLLLAGLGWRSRRKALPR